ncbi:MAG: glycosyltransferase [Sphingobacteriaceae bacterium]|nr:MAG: glycosyltransferase [Sphingobacteriaceae bacterium]
MTSTLNSDKQNTSKISIIIVTLNSAAYLQKCLDSIFSQKYPNLELVILDGKSTDGTQEILQQNNDKITFWQSKPDDGIYDAMNKALDHITGDWVYFLGSDDVLLEDFSELALRVTNPSKIYYANVLLKKKKYRGKVDAYMHAKATVCHQAMIYPRRVFDKHRFNTRYRTSADHDLNMRCWGDREFKFHYEDLIIANYNHTGASSTPDVVFNKEKAGLILKNHGVVTWARFMFKKLKLMINPQPIWEEDDE